MRWTSRQRAAWTVAALVPGALAFATGLDPAAAIHAGAAIVAALGMEALATRLRGGRSLDPASILVALVAALMVPIGSPWWAPMLAAGLAVIVGRGGWTTAGAAPFHPSMLGAALAMLALPTAAAAPGVVGPWPGLFWLGGGWALMAMRVVRPAPAVAMLGAACLGFAASAPDLGEALRGVLADGRIVLVACFVATAPASGALSPAGRWIIGAGTGLAASLAGPERFAAALPYAVLLMNGLAPLVDRAIDATRTPRTAGSP